MRFVNSPGPNDNTMSTSSEDLRVCVQENPATPVLSSPLVLLFISIALII